MTRALGRLSAFAFQVPAAFGMGAHWPLSAIEERMWGESLEECVKALPQKNKKAVIAVMSRWLPWISLSMTAYITVMPRVLTQNLGRAAYGARATEGGAGKDDRGSRGPNGETGGAGRVPTWEDYQREHGG